MRPDDPGLPPWWRPGDAIPDPYSPWPPQPPPTTPGEEEMEWAEHFDNTAWEKGILIDWDGTKWTYTGTAQTLKLYVKSGSTWADSYRPTIISISYKCTDTTVVCYWLIRDAPGNQMGSGEVVDDGQEQTQDIYLDFSGCGDLYQIIFIIEHAPAAYTLDITHIEFYGPIA